MSPRARSKELGDMKEEGRRETSGKLFRFQDLKVWKKAIEIGDKLFDIANKLETKTLYRFIEQVRDASQNILARISQLSA